MDRHTSIIKLYKYLLRAAIKAKHVQIPTTKPISTNQNPSSGVEFEVKLASIDSSRYFNYMGHELKDYIKDEFRSRAKHTDTIRTIQDGISQLESLESICDTKNGEALIHLVLSLRHQQSVISEKTANKYKNKGIHNFNGKLPKHWTSTFAFPVKSYTLLTNDEREKRLRDELHISKQNKYYLLRQYLKEAQQKHMIAVPNLLPYTTTKTPSPAVSKELKIFKSTTVDAILQAYNTKYIEAVVVPELEHKINHHHRLEKMQEIINTKGPYQAKIRATNAAPMMIPFLELPYPQLKEMRDVAMTIKLSMRAMSLQQLWETGNSGAVKNPRRADGAFDVSRFKKYGKSFMQPRNYYESLCRDEAAWEFVIDSMKGQKQEQQQKQGKEQQKKQSVSEKIYQQKINEWTESLNITSDVLDADLKKYKSKYGPEYTQKLVKQRNKLQQGSNRKYNQILQSYDQIKTIIDTEKVSIHSDLVAPRVNKTNTDKTLAREDTTIKRKRVGIPLLERRGLGKRLSDYMTQNNIKPFKMGMKWNKRLGLLNRNS